VGNYKGIIKFVGKFFCVLYSANIGGRETFEATFERKENTVFLDWKFIYIYFFKSLNVIVLLFMYLFTFKLLHMQNMYVYRL
jgi:hypothetical protein